MSSEKQIDTIRSLGLRLVRIDPSRSDPAPETMALSDDEPAVTEQNEIQQRELALQQERMQQLAVQQNALALCEKRFGEAIRQYRKLLTQIESQPEVAAQNSRALIAEFVNDMLREGESAIRLLSEAAGDKSSMHPVNVTVVSLLLGRAVGLQESELIELGQAAFLHDIGKIQLPDRVRWPEDNFSTAEFKLYQEHVGLGVQLGQAMRLPKTVLTIIAQHHELTDGSGFPARLKGDAISMGARILSLVNRYDNLCNPSRPAVAMTPHESLSLIFAQFKARFDPLVLGAFIRMMGVYPPGSVVQLSDDRYGMVVSVNANRPLKPRVIVYEPGTTKREALILDLEQASGISIRRSIKPAALPGEALDFLAPRQRVCYFFEQASDSQMATLE
ncbi:MAG: DUF3391 domain-containing protein [Rhodoferax sp.]|nr:DUF3391 domain-containing protein [Rhodoferax sp.]